MKNSIASFALGVLAALSLSFLAATDQPKPSGADRASIENLHHQDIAATLTQEPKALDGLWDDDGVLLNPGAPALIGKAAISAANAAQSLDARVLSYEPEIKDLQICGNWAFEWGGFKSSYQSSRKAPVSELRARFLRIMKRQADGSWKFTRVMWSPAESNRRSQGARE